MRPLSGPERKRAGFAALLTGGFVIAILVVASRSANPLFGLSLIATPLVFAVAFYLIASFLWPDR